MVSDADGWAPAHTVTRLRQENGSITEIAAASSSTALGNGCPCGTQVGNEPSERRAPVFPGCS